jgi:F1F0 ATPase subunit 2
MAMSELFSSAPAFAAGLFLGAFFFGGLWWTVNRGVSSPRAALWFLGGMLLRMSITLTGFYLVGGEDWQRWLLCLLGFILARLTVTWVTRPPARRRSSRVPETGYAP